MRAVIYAAKSTEDKHGSIPTQLEDARKLAEREGWEVIGSYEDEAKSAYKGNRGTGLTQAMAHAERERCALIVQHSDRLARGDGDRAQHLVEIVLWARKTGVTLKSVQDPQTFDGMGLVYAALMGDRNHEDSARKSASVRDGLRRRADSGKPVGALPIGMAIKTTIVDGIAVTRRVIDPKREPTVRRMFDLAEKGMTPGDISRKLNTEGVTTIRGKPWTTRAVRTVLRNRVYVGENGYPPLIEPEQFEAVQRWLDASTRTWDGRPGRPCASDFPLAEIAVCWHCGAALRSRRCYKTGRRTYRCSNAMEGRNVCADSAPVVADDAEAVFREMLPHFGSNLDAVVVERLDERHHAQSDRKAALEAKRRELAALDRKREQRMAELTEVGITAVGMEVIERIDAERSRLRDAIADAKAVLAEHADQPDTDDLREFYALRIGFAREQIAAASTAAELGAIARRLVERVRLGHIDGRLGIQATLRGVENPQLTLVRIHLPHPAPLTFAEPAATSVETSSG
jgi:DNA invertase Pin-like site-specific DNA recombinase